MKITFDKAIRDQDIKTRATALIQEAEYGFIKPKKLTCNKALVLNITLRIRAIKFKGKNEWLVMGHEKYNRHCKRGY
ncbi:hypothetical protein [Vibrio vulnificus]|uniref:ParE family toxin-like protein n=1 Tax=Vibrio vulnificus TaxID=672 RepID=UPI003D322C45